jgi:hypothetical protein
MNNIPELNITLTSVEVKSETRESRYNLVRERYKYFENDIYFLRANRIESIINIFNIKKHDR